MSEPIQEDVPDVWMQHMRQGAFAEAWKHFEALQFEETFEAIGLATLRHNQKNWDVIHTSQFKNI